VAAQAGGVGDRPAWLRANLGNFVLCYDIADPATLRAVAADIAAETARVQRSVYWLRAPVARLKTLLQCCAPRLDAADRLWAYPLGTGRALWRLDATPAVLPIAA